MNYFTPTEAVTNYAKAGAAKTKTPVLKLLLLGVLAGVFIAYGGVMGNTAMYSFENVSAGRVICGLLFPIGFCMVILTGAELFTGNCLIIVSVLDRKTTVLSMLRNWVPVYAGNFFGSIAIAAGCVFTGQLNYSSGRLAIFAIKLASAKCALPFGNAFVLGVLCNMLIVVAVIQSSAAKDIAGRIMGAFIPVTVFVVCGFEHCVANMCYISCGLFAIRVQEYAQKAAAAGINTGMLTWKNFFLHNLLPVTLGNIIGGVVIGIIIWSCYLKNNKNQKSAEVKQI